VSVVFHADPAAFARAAQPVASRSPCSQGFVAIWCAGLAQHPPGAGVPWLLATAEVDGARAIAMQHGVNPLLLELSDPAAVRALAHALADRGQAIPGVDGSEAACDAFARTWRERTGRVATERVRLRHHVLEAVRELAPPPPGRMRAATGDDAAWLADALEAFVVEANVPRPPQGIARAVAQRLADDRYRVWDDGAVVSFLGANVVEGYGRIGPVYTPPSRRGRGHATALVAAASRELLARGARFVSLTTDRANPVSNAIYARVGYRPVDDTVGLDFVDP
jgi:predicted GNAT family acetyltransferase